MQYKSWKKNLFTVICRKFFKCRVYAFWGTFLTLKFCLGTGEALLETMVGAVASPRGRGYCLATPLLYVRRYMCFPQYATVDHTRLSGTTHWAATCGPPATPSTLSTSTRMYLQGSHCSPACISVLGLHAGVHRTKVPYGSARLDTHLWAYMPHVHSPHTHHLIRESNC